ncbi:MAG: ATPase, T2SS/T4P/T4SS family [Thermoplasmatota archaeon]
MSGKAGAGRIDGSRHGAWWSGIAELAERSLMEKPSFSGSWLLPCETIKAMDSRENRFLKTMIISDEEGESRRYVVDPFEYRMRMGAVRLVRRTMEDLGRHPPPQAVIDDENGLRSYIENRASGMLSRTDADVESVQVLSRLAGQYTSGYGIIEHLLRDERVQDIYIDAPAGSRPVYVTLGGAMPPELQGTYPTNIQLTEREMRRLTSILSYYCGRPFNEAVPVLECDMELYNARATAVSPPLSPRGISLALRKHSHDPWTLLRLVKAGSITDLAAGFLSMAADGRSSMMIAGPRGAGKSSLLGALLFELDPSQRIIIIEDTPELPTRSLSISGYKVLGLTVGSSEAATSEKALRTALRLGESVIVMGEVRGPETKILYEAMSAGTAGSAVMGTFHADSAVSVYKRAVEDLGVSPGSFSATDLVVVSGLVQPRGAKTRMRRVVQIAELVKEGPQGTFRDLFTYDSRNDRLLKTPDYEDSGLVSRISKIWGISRSELLSEIELRSRIFRESLKVFRGKRSDRPGSAVRSNVSFRQVKETATGEGWMDQHERFVENWRFAAGEVWD